MVTVDDLYSPLAKDELLIQSVPPDIKIHRVKALSTRITGKFGLGSLALRSLWHYRKKVNRLLNTGKYDLIYFSTTQFPVCILGAYWKKRFNISYVIDMQDPWHSEYYKNKPKQQRPPKYWFTYRLHKYLEPIAMKKAGGLISVSEGYITDLKKRYNELNNVPAVTITFGAFEDDLKIATGNEEKFENLLQNSLTNIAYVGRGGADMHKAITPVFEALKRGLANQPEVFGKIRLNFIGTSYAPTGKGSTTILPLAIKYGVEANVIEKPDRISYYHTLLTLQQADALFMPGSDDPKYTASKIYPYLLSDRPLLAIFHSQSSALAILDEYGAKYVYSFDKSPDITARINDFFTGLVNKEIGRQKYDDSAKKKYSAREMTARQCDLFNSVLKMQK